jgi:hypothetical protein
MTTATPTKLSTQDVCDALIAYAREALGYETDIWTSIEHIDCRRWASNPSFPSSCSCKKVALSQNPQIQRLFPTTTAKIIMHGFIPDSATSKGFDPAIYFVDSDNKSSWPSIRAPTTERLITALKKVALNAAGRDDTGAARHSVAPSDQSQMIQVLQQILEVCNRIDNKVKA